MELRGGQQSEVYDNALLYYEKYKKVYDVKTEVNYDNYLDNLIENQDRYIVSVSATKEFIDELEPERRELLQSLGCDLSLYDDNSTCWTILDGGVKVYETGLSKKITDEYDNFAGESIQISNASEFQELSVGDKAFSIEKNGLNLLVYDKESGLYTDYVCFYYNKRGLSCSRSKRAGFYSDNGMNEYSYWLLKNY